MMRQVSHPRALRPLCTVCCSTSVTVRPGRKWSSNTSVSRNRSVVVTIMLTHIFFMVWSHAFAMKRGREDSGLNHDDGSIMGGIIYGLRHSHSFLRVRSRL